LDEVLGALQALLAPPRHMLLILAAGWLGLHLADRRAGQYGLASQELDNIAGAGMLAFILGGRMGYVLIHAAVFIQAPAGIVSLNPGLFSPLLGGAAALAASAAYVWQRRLALTRVLDALTPLLAILAIGAGLSNLASGAAFGKPSDVPWSITLWGAQRHPSQSYETLAATLTMLAAWRTSAAERSGTAFAIFAAWTAGWNIFLRAFRAEGTWLPNGTRLDQVAAWLALFVALVMLDLLSEEPAEIKTARH